MLEAAVLKFVISPSNFSLQVKTMFKYATPSLSTSTLIYLRIELLRVLVSEYGGSGPKALIALSAYNSFGKGILTW